MKFTKLTVDEYNLFRKINPCRDFMNSLEAMELKKMNHWEVEYVGVKEGNNVLCATPLTSIPVMKVYRFYYAQRGFLIDYQNKELLTFFTKELLSYLKKKKALYLIADPNVLYKERNIDGDLVEDGFDNSYVIQNMEQAGFIHQGLTNNFQVLSEIRWMFSLYLDSKDEATLLKEMHQQTRWSINKTIKQDIKIRELSVDEIDYFIKMMDHTSQRRGFAAREKDFYMNQMIAFKDKAKLLMAYLDIDDFNSRLKNEEENLQNQIKEVELKLQEIKSKKYTKKKKELDEAIALNSRNQKEAHELEEKYGKIIPMATSFFILDEDEIIYLYSAAYDAFKKYNAPYAIQWYMIRYALNHNYKKYNFYGISGDFSKDAQDYGVYMFKKGFNGVVEELVGDFVLPVKKLPYKLYKALKHK